MWWNNKQAIDHPISTTSTSVISKEYKD